MATNLAIQPTDEPLKKKLKSRLTELENERRIPEEVWQLIADHVIPRLWDILGTGVAQGGSSSDKHKKYGAECYDGSPAGMLQLLADGLHGYLVSPAIQWFRLRMGQPVQNAMRSPVMMKYMRGNKRLDDIPDIKSYLESCEETYYSVYDDSNFYDAMAEYLLHGGSIGTATMWPEWDFNDNKPVFTVLHPRENFIAENKYGRVDTLFRKYRLTARQILQRCDLDGKGIDPRAWDATKLTDNIINAVNSNSMEKEFEVIHAIYPRTDRNIKQKYGERYGKAKPWASVHFLTEGGDDDDTILCESGFDRFPAVSWRWRKDTGRIYGSSPAWDALIDILGLNTMAKTLLTVAHKAADPPMMAPASMRGLLRLSAQGINYYSDKDDRIEAIDSGIMYPIAKEDVERKLKIIEQHFKVDFFLMLTRAEKQMTATEVIEKQGEKAAVLGSTIGRLNNEAMNPISDIMFDMLDEARLLPQPPQVLIDYVNLTGQGKIDTVYIGPLAQAQRRLFTSQGVTRSLEMALPIMQMVPETLMKVNWMEVIDEIFAASGMPQKCIVSDEEIEKLQEAKAQMMAKEKQKTDMMQGLEMLKTGAQADQATGGKITEAMQNVNPEQIAEMAGGIPMGRA
jgi:hypothetical protein